MKPEDEGYLAGREERVKFGKRTVIVRELASAAELPMLKDDSDATYRLLVRSVFEEDGEQTFTDDDIPKLKRASRRRVSDLLVAAARVNGLDGEVEAKNSDAAPSGG
jgi:hypothetical protein